LPALLDIMFYDGQPAQTLGQALGMQAKIDPDYQNGDSIHWGIVDPSNGAMMGTVGYYRGFPQQSGELGCVLKPAFRGRGVMTRAIRLAAGFGLDEMGLSRVMAITTAENTPAIRLLERLNFTKTADRGGNKIEFQLSDR
ncbi:MAG: GNAT family N-acetyltransferase, partial [Saprospiraceae bacterium]|nr:GNAT family N-acetyltransferase [Saprospiraceae bacterium]